MAQKRMFSKSITNSSQFLMMPQSSQNLYFHLGMNADDDGFCEHFTIMRMTDSKPDDLKILQAKKFINVFDDRVLVIIDWKENNLIRADRYTPSKYLEIYKEEIKGLSSGIPMVALGKVRLGKDSIGENNTSTSSKEEDAVKSLKSEEDKYFKEVLSIYEETGISIPDTIFRNKTERKAGVELYKKKGIEKVRNILEYCMENKVFYNFTTPNKLLTNYEAIRLSKINKDKK